MKRCRKNLHDFSDELDRCPACRKISQSTWKKDHRKEVAEYEKSWQKANKRNVAIRKKNYWRTNTGKINAIRAKRYASKLHRTPKWLTPDQLKQMEAFYIRANTWSFLLNSQIDVDHIYPLQGKIVSGLHHPDNMQLLPHTLNCSKGNKMPEEVLKYEK